MKCTICGRETNGKEPNIVPITEREVDVHIKYFHNSANEIANQNKKITCGVCPDCGATLHFESGCVHCSSCGWDKC